MTDGTNNVTTVSNSWYANGSWALLNSATTPTTNTTYGYDQYGNAVSQTTNGLATSVTMDPTHNSVVPSSITTGSTSVALQWSGFLGLTQSTGQNGDAAQVSYDGNGFPANTTSPYGATTNNSYTIYSGAGSPTTVLSKTNNHFSRQTLDGVGHVVKQITGTFSGSTYTTVSEVDSVYAPCGCSPMGKLAQVSQPYAPGGTVYWTTYAYDGLGRTTSVTLPDNSVTQYVYDDLVPGTNAPASYVRVIDPAGKQKRYRMDGFGHLTMATEDPNGLALATNYSYDVLDHLTQVQQTRSGTTQTRTFSYMSGSTLTGYLQSATNPENGTVTYTYNSDGTLKTKTDNAGVVTGYTYDGQKRLLTVGMKVNGTIVPAYTYTYDTGTYNKGRLATITYANFISAGSNFITDDMITETYSYTQPGEVSQKSVSIGRCPTGPPACTYASPLNISATYDNEGHRKTMTTPAQGFKYTYDQMERATGMTDAASGNTIVSGIQYNPANQLLQISYNGVTETRTYNSLLQLTGINTGTVNLTYNYTAGQNNGKIASTTNNVSGENVVYQYDSLNRLIQAQTTAGPTPWGQQYVYDGFGNLYQKNVTQGSAPSMSLTVDPTTNRLTNTGGQAFSYDANGNMLSGPTIIGNQSYDFRNRVTSANNGYYGYDARNRRIYKMTVQSSQSMTEVYYLFGLSGENLGTYTPNYTAGPPASFTLTLATARTYFFGKKLWATEDNVGSGASAGSYYPYGEDKGTSPPPNEQYKFATYWRDSESGLDYAQNRYYSSTLGRFLSPDPYPGSMDPKNPESMNSYAYVMNNPVNGNDPSGLEGSADTSICYVDGSPFPIIICYLMLAASQQHLTPFQPPDQEIVSLANSYALVHQKLNSWLRSKTANALKNLSSQCQNALKSDGIDLNSVEATASKTEYFNAVGVDGLLTVRAVTDAPDDETLIQALGSARAVTLPGVLGSLANDVVIGLAFLTSLSNSDTLSGSEDITLVHEALHTGTGLGDADLANTLHVSGNWWFNPSTESGNDAASDAISRWLAADCPASGVTPQ